ncbi:MAG: flippase-like domain-containing protein [Verrucomicrobiae bacterium]|nr:flippase-like domain-containing protein [Verrucomicrobiae bacterium]
MKKNLLIATKLVLTATIFWWVIHKLDIPGLQVEGRGEWALISAKLAHLAGIVRGANVGLLLSALAMLVGTMTIGIVRWQLLLRVQGIHLGNYHATWITASGMFFNAFLIGATGGDVLKAWYAAEAAPLQKTRAVLSIAVDRLIGVLGLMGVASLCVLTNLPMLMTNDATRPLGYLILASIPCVAAGIALFSMRRRLTSRSWWGAVWRFVPFKKLLGHLMESYNAYGRRPRVLAAAFFLSMGVHVSIVLVAWLIGLALGVQGASLVHYLVYCPIINAIAAIPITIGGLGLREGAFKFFFNGLLGVPQEQCVTLSLVFYAATLALSLACGVLFLIGKPKSFPRRRPEAGA